MTDIKPEISIVMPAYNAAKYIREAISSVLEQTFTAWELIVVNDGSTDNTPTVVKEFKDPRIRLIEQKNMGVSAARNTGIKNAQGKFIAFLDSDDAFTPENLQRKYNVLNADQGLDFVYSDIWMCDKELNPARIEEGVEGDVLFKEVLLWNRETIPCLPSNLVIRASKLGGDLVFDVNLSNCADRYMKILIAKELKGKYIHETLVKYRDTPGSMSKKVWLLEHDEKYIISQIVAKNIIPQGSLRRRVIANIYMILSGSWFVDARKPLKAIKYGIKAIITYPPFAFRLLKKSGRKLVP